jgi:hypothetical protein
MNKNNLIKMGIIVLLVVILMNSVFALGVSPVRKAFNYAPGTISGSIELSNNQNQDVDIIIYASGEYKDIISFDKRIINFESGDNSEEINYKLTLSQGMDPGRHDIIVNIDTVNAGLESDITAKNTILAHVYIDVPYPGKYIDSKFNIDSKNTGETTAFTISLFSRGSQQVDDISGTVIIKGPTNEEITRIDTNSISLAPEKSGKIVATWVANVNPGLYYVEAIINYAGKQIVERNTFVIGEKTLNIKDVLIENFRLGNIAKIDVIAESTWNKDIKDVYAEVDVIDEKGLTVSTVETLTQDITPLGRAILSGYWDTKGLTIGNYDINVKLFYGDKISEKLFQTIINMDSIHIEDSLLIAGQVTGVDTGKGTSTLTLLIIAVLVLIIINVFWFTVLKKIQKKIKK